MSTEYDTSSTSDDSHDDFPDINDDDKSKTALTLLSSIGDWDLEQAIEFNGEQPSLILSCVHELVHIQAVNQPHTLAIHAWDGQLTYSELDFAANRLSRYLINSVGVSLGDLIHVCFEKSVWFFVAILAINKAGAAWIPLDPSHPISRQQQILKQTGARLALVSPSNAAMSSNLGMEVLEVTANLNEKLINKFGPSPPAPSVNTTSNHAAYVLFTSGSTGVPKGFVMEHGSVCTSQTAISNKLGLAPGIRILQFASYVFDLSIGEIIAPLITGATVCVPSEDARMNSLPDFIRMAKVTWAFLTPSFARTLKPKDMPGLELLLLTGEAVGRDVFETWVGRLRLVTGWGPAETCVFSTLHEWKTKDESPQTIGRPVGAHCWIVDPENPEKLAPTGWIGEVMIQGPTLLREYLNDPVRTGAATVSVLPSWTPNATSPNWNRFFKSGDLCRYNPDGTIEFISRKDTQVKIRGLRVELGEVEHNFRAALPNVRQIVVDELKGNEGSSLAAFFCYNDDTRVLASNIEADAKTIFLPLTRALQDDITLAIRHMTISLPNYMIPTAFFPCHFMPSITSTKIDRGALKRLAGTLSQELLTTYTLAGGEKRAPETIMEARMQQCWSKILKIPLESIGRDDSFFRVGGDSITAVRLVALAREEGLTITANDIFTDPRLFAVAARTTENPRAKSFRIEPFDLVPNDEASTVKSAIREVCKLTPDEDIEDAYPCTSLQEGLMALAVKQPGSYIAKHVYRLPKNIDGTHFKAAWNDTLELCTNLRTRIVTYENLTIQAVIGGDPAWEPTEGISLRSFMNISKPIEMQYGSRLCRYAFISESNGDHYFVLIVHHAVFDGWSLNIALTMLSDIFAEKPVSAPEPYSGFINYTQQIDEDAANKYWRGQLDGAQRSEFPRQRTTTVDTKPASRVMRHKIMFESMLDDSITKATILRSTWAIVLARYCDSNDVCFGTTVSGRQAPVPGVDEMTGPAVTTIPVRIQLDGNTRVSKFLEAVQEQAADMVAYEQFGLRRISKTTQEAKEACDFSSLLIIQPLQQITSTNNAAESEVLLSTAPGSYTDEDVVEGYYTYPLVIQCFTYDNHVELLLIFNPNVILESQIEGLSHHFDSTFQQLLTRRNLSVNEVSLASDWDLQRAREFNSDVPQVVRACIHQIIERQSRIHPENVAVDAWDGQLTYSELNSAANRLSHHLRDFYGVQTGDFIHVCFEKSIWFFIAILAINKAGAAWVPLDPSYPFQRQEQIVKQTKARVALSSSINVEKCIGLVPLIVEVCSALDKRLATVNISPMAPVCEVTPDHAAYALFTSGSTGTPKGLVMQHRALCSNMTAFGKRLEMSSNVRMLQFSAFVFDICIGEIIGSWIFGATVCVPSDEMRMNGLKEFINDYKVNWAYLTSSVARTLKPTDVPGLELLLLSGEFIGRDVFDSWVENLRFIAAWGPAETCVWNSLNDCYSKKQSPQTIGRPVGAYCWIVDPSNPKKLAPIGCVGEVMIQGPPLLHEYLSDPVRTAAAVVTELPEWAPNATLPNWNRFFKSGDLCYYNPDGTMEFVSRKDTQVKIRGLRIELGEIERHLHDALPNVQQAVVDVFKGDTGLTLAAYFCCSDEMRVTNTATNPNEVIMTITADLEEMISTAIRHLTNNLPNYMVPTLFFPCQFMPSIISGKLDRKTLKRLTATLGQELLATYSLTDSKKRAPETPMEVHVQQAWSTVLQIPLHSIGRDDSFFRIGGDSITAIQFVKLVRESDLIITVQDVFADPRLSSVATKMAEGQGVTYDVQPFGLLSSDLDAIKTRIYDQCCLSDKQEIEDAYPCSSTQEGLMALAMKQPGSYTAKYVYQLSARVDISRFKEAWKYTLQACGNLRTRIISHGGESIQTVIKEQPEWEPANEGVDLRSFMDTTNTIHMKYGSRLCRYALITDGDGRHFFVLIVHHSIFDGWSLNIVLERLRSTYQGGSTPALLPYSSFINYAMQVDKTAAITYWTTQLTGAHRTPFPRTSLTNLKPTCRVMRISTPFPDFMSSSITKATILRAAWAILLSRYSDSDDVCFGTTVSGRQAPLSAVDSMPGPTIATVPIRIKLEKKDTLLDFLQTVQQQASDMVAYEQFGLRNIANACPEAKEACDFSSLLVIQPTQTSLSDAAPEEAIFSSMSSDMYNKDQSLDGYFSYPLVAQCLILDDRVDLEFIYNSGVISEKILKAFSYQFEHVVSQLCKQPDTLVGGMNIASPWDIQQAIQWNQTDDELTIMDSCIHQLFVEQAQLRPQDIAVAAWDKEFTYDELNKASNRVSHLLINGFGVTPGDLIHVCFEKSAWFVVAILAINKAGGAWVPLDPSHPASRHKQIIQQTGGKITVASPTHAAACSELVPYVIELSTSLDKKLEKRSKRLSMRPPAGYVSPTDAAYVLFTSGTTGVPKGVVMEHRSVCTSQVAISKRLDMQPGVRILQFSAYVFDVSVGEMIGALISGACVCIPSDFDRMNNLKGFIHNMNVNWAFLTPTFARTIKPHEVPSLEVVVLAGEAVNQDVFEMWYGNVRLVNGWGPAETCVFSSLHEWTCSNASSTTIGRPVGGYLWIVDPDDPQKLAPTGCVGEIVMQGPTLLREYLHDPTQTANAMVSSPPDWAVNSQSADWNRFYRTGDLGYYNSDGTVEYVGRKDTQVKIRGLRIELGEVEHHIRTLLKGVRQVAVDVVKTERAAVLVAYISYSDNNNILDSNAAQPFMPLTPELEDQVRATVSELSVLLPQYMIPTMFIPCKYLPFTTSGKLDRKGLHSMVAALTADEIASYALNKSKHRPPETEMEIKLQKLWADILQIPANIIGRDDSFLALGGDSIFAIQLVTLADEHGISLTVASIFENPILVNVAAAASLKEGEEFSAESWALIPSNIRSEVVQEAIRQCQVHPDRIQDAFPCAPLQDRLLAFAIKQPGCHFTRLIFELRPDINFVQFKTALRATVSACTNLRTRIIFSKHGAMQIVLDERASWRRVKGFSLADVLNMPRPNIGYGTPLSFFTIVSNNAHNHLIWDLHHSIYDGSTMQLVSDILQATYNGQEHFEPVPFRNYINYTLSTDSDAAQHFWTSQLEGANTTKFPDTSLAKYKKRSLHVVTRETQIHRPPISSITLPSLLRAAWAFVVAKYLKTNDVVFGYLLSGRDAPVSGIQKIIGPTHSNVPCRIRIDSAATIAEYLMSVQEQSNAMISFSHTGLQNISSFNDTTQKACDFQHMLITQPSPKVKDDPTAPFHLVDNESLGIENGNNDYEIYPLVIQCLVGDDGHITVFLKYNAQFVTPEQVDWLGKQFECVAAQLAAQDASQPLWAIKLTDV